MTLFLYLFLSLRYNRFYLYLRTDLLTFALFNIAILDLLKRRRYPSLYSYFFLRVRASSIA